MEKISRNQYVDFLKGLLIYLVILGHFVQVYGISSFQADWLHNLIYAFHMPLFIAISGFFCYKSLRRNTMWIFLKRRIVYLFVPLVIWDIFMSVIYKHEHFNFFYVLADKFSMCYWYIWAMIFYSIFMCFLIKIVLRSASKWMTNVCLIISVFLIMLIPGHYFSIHIIKSMYPFFVTGYIISTLDFSKVKTFSKFLLPEIFIVSVLCFILWNARAYVFATPSSFNNLEITLFRFVAGCSISTVFIYLTHFLYKKYSDSRLIKLISDIGTKTLGIYFLQEFLFHSAVVYDIKIYTTWINILCVFPAIIILLIIYQIIKYVSRNKVAGFILFGEKLS